MLMIHEQCRQAIKIESAKRPAKDYFIICELCSAKQTECFAVYCFDATYCKDTHTHTHTHCGAWTRLVEISPDDSCISRCIVRILHSYLVNYFVSASCPTNSYSVQHSPYPFAITIIVCSISQLVLVVFLSYWRKFKLLPIYDNSGTVTILPMLQSSMTCETWW